MSKEQEAMNRFGARVESAVVFGVRISVISKDRALALITDWVRGSRSAGKHVLPKMVVTPNAEMVVASQKDRKLLTALNVADLAIPDGKSLRLICPNLNRITGVELARDIVKKASIEGWAVLLIGGKPGVAERAARRLFTDFDRGVNGFRVTGIQGSPNVGRSTTADDRTFISGTINSIEPNVLLVGFGHPKQELWMKKHRFHLRVGVMMGVGGFFDQVIDPTLRVPAFLDRLWLGWLYRLVRQPWRWRRQLSLVCFIKLLIRHKLPLDKGR